MHDYQKANEDLLAQLRTEDCGALRCGARPGQQRGALRRVRGRADGKIDSETFDRVLQVNVRGSFECIRAVLPHMRRQGYGKIVNVTSVTVWLGTPGMLAYVSSKGAVLAMTRSAARELGPTASASTQLPQV